MILLKSEILERIEDKDIIIRPFNKRQLNTNSYNIKLHNELLVYKNDVLDMKKNNETEKIIIPEDGYTLQPNQLYLGRTVEYTETKNKIIPMIEGRSSIGRLGIFIHVTAGFGDVGFAGYWTLEIFCIKPITIYPNVEIGQLYYLLGEGEEDRYTGKYNNNNGIQQSMLFKEFEN